MRESGAGGGDHVIAGIFGAVSKMVLIRSWLYLRSGYPTGIRTLEGGQYPRVKGS